MIGLCALIVAWVLVTALELLADRLNLRSADAPPPPELAGVWAAGESAQSAAYRRDKTRFHGVNALVNLAALILILTGGGLGLLDRWIGALNLPPIATGLLFMAAGAALAALADLPFDIYRTFGIERRHGFNRTTPRTFILDLLKGWALTALLGLPVLAGVFWFFSAFPETAWLWAWAFTSLIQLFILYLAPVLIAPLFNRFIPLPEGELKDRISAYAGRERFKIRGIYTMDGSRRSSKANAYFCGIGRFRRIVLFDTLVEKFSPDEILAVVAHEMGHFKRHHMPLIILQALATNAVTFLILAACIRSPAIAQTLGFDQPSLHAGLMATLFLLIPIALPIRILNNILSRRCEFQADAYAVQTTGLAAPLRQALIKLTRDHRADLTPHPLKVLLDYSHPPLLARLRALPVKPDLPAELEPTPPGSPPVSAPHGR